MTISIWYRREGCAPEVVDRASSEREANYLAHEYAMAFGTSYGQHRHGKDKVWAGRKEQDAKMRIAKCDNCGETDNWRMGKLPFFYGGLVLQFRSDKGSEQSSYEYEELELCEVCREKLLTAFPNLKKIIEGRK